MQRVEQALAVAEVLGVPQVLHVPQRLDVGEGLLALVLGHLDVALARHEVAHVVGRDRDALDRVRGGHGVGGQEGAQAVGPVLRRSPELMVQPRAKVVDLRERGPVTRREQRCPKQHDARLA